MFPFRLPRPHRTQCLPLTDTQRALVETKFDILQGASFGFTDDRLLHIQEEDLKIWTDACTEDLRRRIAAAAPPNVKTALIEFRALRCLSLQCLPLARAGPGQKTQVMQYNAVVALGLLLLASLAGPRPATAQVPTAADFGHCNADALQGIKMGAVWPTKGDYARADRARGVTLTATPKSADAKGKAIESPDPQIHGMEAEGAKDALYQAAYRSCMRRQGF
jgi:hypothetical protein